MARGELLFSACAAAALLLAAGRSGAQDENGEQSAVGATVSSDTAPGANASSGNPGMGVSDMVNAAMAGAAGASSGAGAGGGPGGL